MQRSNVDLPDPDAPIKTVAVCSGTVSDKSFRTSSAPKDLRMFTSYTVASLNMVWKKVVRILMVLAMCLITVSLRR